MTKRKSHAAKAMHKVTHHKKRQARAAHVKHIKHVSHHVKHAAKRAAHH